jgi:hypothetical protein
MSIGEALKQAKRQKQYGLVLMSIAFILFTFGLLKTMYWEVQADQSIFRPITQLAGDLIVMIYENTQFLFFGWFWEISPGLDLRNILNKYNIEFLAVVSMLGFGSVLRDSGRKLSKRLNKVIERAQDRMWERELTGEQVRTRIMQLEFTFENNERWHTRPLGILFLTIIGGYIVNVLSKLTGLS